MTRRTEVFSFRDHHEVVHILFEGLSTVISQGRLNLSSTLFTLFFGDDTTLLKSHSDFNELVKIINVEFKEVVDSFRIHKLTLHPSKTKFMVCSNSAKRRS
jgi:hypothetical protein